MEILDEGVLDKGLEGTDKSFDGKTWKTIHEVIDDEYLKQSYVKFPNDF